MWRIISYWKDGHTEVHKCNAEFKCIYLLLNYYKQFEDKLIKTSWKREYDKFGL